MVGVQQLAIVLALAEPQTTELQSPAVIVLDFEGSELHYVPDSLSDPDAGITPYGECEGVWPPYGDPDRQRAILQRVSEQLEAFDVVVTDELPCEGPWLRVMVGPFSGCGSGVGLAESRCDRRLGHGIAYAQLHPDSHRSIEQEATTITHEIGHAFGLAHVDNPADIMHPTIAGGGKAFLDVCSPLDDSSLGGDSCQVIGHCPTLSPTGQNSHFGLMSILGPARADAAPRCNQLDAEETGGCGCRAGLAGPSYLTLWLVLMASPLGRRR